MWWGLWEQLPSCLTHTHIPIPTDMHTHIRAHAHRHIVCYKGSGWGKPLICRLLSQAQKRAHAHTHSVSPAVFHTQTHAHTHAQWSHILIRQLRWSQGNTLISVSLPPPLWHVVISRVQMFGDIFTHTWWQTTSVVSPAWPSSNRLLQPWPDPQPVLQRVVPNTYLAQFVKKEQTER